MKERWHLGLLGALSLAGVAGSAPAGEPSGYAVVMSRVTHEDAAWREVAEVLRARHGGNVTIYQTNVAEALPALRRQSPRFACFVARPTEAGRDFVAQVHRLARELDDDPYPDCFWGILTGYDAAAALRMAMQSAPLTVRKVAAGTEVALDLCEEGRWYCELNQGKMVEKLKGGQPGQKAVPADTTRALVQTLADYQPDLFVTSGHATERDWQIGFRYRNGYFRCAEGLLYGLDTQGTKFPIHSPNPKVYLPVGNCLMGHIDRPDCMALAWMNSAGVCQMIGYTQPTWYGYMGWGMLDYFLEQPGRFTLAEAFFANQAALIHRLRTFFPGADQADGGGKSPARVEVSARARAAGLSAQDARGLLFDRDVVAFYGDPAWDARMAPARTAWEQTLSEKDGLWTLIIKPNRGEQSFDPINRNGSQRGGRPLVHFFPRRLCDIKVTRGAELEPVIADDFILVPHPGKCDPAREYRVEFTAKTLR